VRWRRERRNTRTSPPGAVTKNGEETLGRLTEKKLVKNKTTKTKTALESEYTINGACQTKLKQKLCCNLERSKRKKTN